MQCNGDSFCCGEKHQACYEDKLRYYEDKLRYYLNEDGTEFISSTLPTNTDIDVTANTYCRTNSTTMINGGLDCGRYRASNRRRAERRIY
jgi:hypothetical protein